MLPSISASRPLAPTRVRYMTNTPKKKVNWTKEEDQRLKNLVSGSQSKPNWSKIAQNFPNKTTQQVTERWDKVIDPTLIKGSWTRHEDEIIIDFVKKHGSKNWTKLAKLLPGRIGKQCRERWRNHLDPSIKHTTWTDEEDSLLLKLHEQFGNQWVKISSLIPGRTENAIKNRWNATLKKTQVHSNESSSTPPMTEPEIHKSPTSPFISLVDLYAAPHFIGERAPVIKHQSLGEMSKKLQLLLSQ